MKITKKKGYKLKEVSQLRLKEKGILGELKAEEKIDRTDEKINELKLIRLNAFIKTPKEKKDMDYNEKENKNRREKLQKYFSNLAIEKKDEIVKLIVLKSSDMKVEELKETDLKPYIVNKKEEIIFVLNKILRKEKCDEVDLKIFKFYLDIQEKKLNKIKNSIEKNKSQFKVENNKIEIIGKRNKFYEYYLDNKKMVEYIKNINENFEKLFTEEEVNSIKNKLLEKENKKVELYETYKKILERSREKISKEKFEIVSQNIDEAKKLKILTASQIIYKYFENSYNENIESLFPYFVEYEMKELLKKIYEMNKSISPNYKKEKINLYFKDYDTTKKLIENKLKNKLLNYIESKGKINEYFLNENKYIESFDLSLIRNKESALRNIIGAVSSSYFSFRNIVNPEEEKDIFNKGKFDSGMTKNILEIENRVKLFYGNTLDGKNSIDIKNFLDILRKYIYEIRNNSVHFKMESNIADIFKFSKGTSDDETCISNIYQKEFENDYLKIHILSQLNSSNVFKYIEIDKIREYLEKVEFNIQSINIGFVPSFYKIYNKFNDYAKGLKLNFKVTETSNEVEIKEKRDAQIYLLKQIYYNNFLGNFLNNNEEFSRIVKKVISLNREEYMSRTTGFSKLDKFDEIEIATPKEYIGKLQSLYMISFDKEENEEGKNLFLSFVNKIFMKGFSEYVYKNFKFIVEDYETKTDLKEKLDGEILKIKKDYKNISQSGDLFEENKFCNSLLKDIRIKNFPDFKVLENKMFFYFLKLIDNKELSNLRGNFEKIRAITNENLEEKYNVLNLAMMFNEKMILDDNKDLNLSLFEKFVDIKLLGTREEKIKQIYEFSKNNKPKDLITNESIYSDGINLIENKSLYNMKKHCMENLLGKIVDKGNYKVTKSEIEEYFEMKFSINEKYKAQEELHKGYEKNKRKFKEEEEKYRETIEFINEYNILKNKIELNDINLLQSILLKILHRTAGYTSLWERDLKFRLKMIANDSDSIEDIFEHDNSCCKKYKKGQIASKYKIFLNEPNNIVLKNFLPKNYEIRNIVLRNYIAHFNYLPEPSISLVEVFGGMRHLLDYDRKLKNAYLKSMIKIFEEYGFILKLKIDKNKNITVDKIESVEIGHIGNKIKLKKYSENMCNVLKTMLEYKK